jgi:hypothetical protein
VYSSEHAAVGTVVSALGVAVLWSTADLGAPALAALFAWGVLLSVFVDLDHYLLARLSAGDWSHLRAALADPPAALTDQEGTFEGIEDIVFQRLLTHHLVGAALVFAFAPVSVPVAVFTAVILYAHVVCDLLRDAGLA